MKQCLAITTQLKRCKNSPKHWGIFCETHKWWWLKFLGGIVGVVVTVTTIGANVSQMYGVTFSNPLQPTVTSTPTHMPTMTLTPSITPTVTETSTITITPTFTPTSTDTPTYTPTPTEIPLLSQDCFSIEKWTPYEKDSLISKDNGCWNLYKWGFTAKENEIIIVAPNSSKGIYRGIYTPVENNAEINFKIRVDKFDVEPGVTANIGIGIINLDPPGPATSRLIFYHYIPQESEFYIPIKTGVDANYKDLIPLTLKFSKPQEVVLTMDGPFLKIVFDNDTEVNLTIPFEKRAFWFSYVVPPSSELIMSIYDLEIK